MKTYKTTDPATLAALVAQNKACKALQAQGLAFKERFGAAHFIGGNTPSTGYKIHGLVFEPPKPRLLWTAPDRQAAGVQRPRTSLAKSPPGTTTEERHAQREELKELRQAWHEAAPMESVSWTPVLDRLGTDWGATWLSGFALFEHEGVIYVKTGAALAAHCTEILGSEYEAAEAAHRKVSKTDKSSV